MIKEEFDPSNIAPTCPKMGVVSSDFYNIAYTHLSKLYVTQYSIKINKST